MGKPIRVLIVEDDERDAQLVLRELRRGGFEVSFERVETPAAMTEALLGRPWDLIISDYSMPRFSALMALDVVKQLAIDLPFIIVSGTVGEDVAVEGLHAGARDFVAKGNLARLLPAIERELREAAARLQQGKMREQLLISERMASVGTLAAGVAHEINNPLAALIANIEFVTADVNTLIEDLGLARAKGSSVSGAPLGASAIRVSEIEQSLRHAQESADRIKHIVRDLKVFSRADEGRTSAIDVQKVLRSSVRIAMNEIRHRARLVEEYGDVPAVTGLEGQLGQVFLNLIVNAAQAIPEGNAGAHEVGVTTRQDDQGRVVVEVRDTGAGISEANLSRIFDPFFTTKPIGIGTGLGLAICYRIVTGLGGQLTVASEVGKGTTFRAILPAASEPVAPPSVAIESVAPTRRGGVLVVDDEPLLGTVLKRMLGRAHDVVAVTGARDALARLLKGEQYDVILCDLMMPDMTGMDLYAELLSQAPPLAERLIFMTGGAFTSRAHDFLEGVDNERIEKPIDPKKLNVLIQRFVGRYR